MRPVYMAKEKEKCPNKEKSYPRVQTVACWPSRVGYRSGWVSGIVADCLHLFLPKILIDIAMSFPSVTGSGTGRHRNLLSRIRVAKDKCLAPVHIVARKRTREDEEWASYENWARQRSGDLHLNIEHAGSHSDREIREDS